MKVVKQAQCPTAIQGTKFPPSVASVTTLCVLRQAEQCILCLSYLFYKMGFFFSHTLGIKEVHQVICNSILPSVELLCYEIFVTAQGQ